MNHLLLIFKKSVYEMRFRSTPPSVNYSVYKSQSQPNKKIEYMIAKDSNKLEFHLKK